ncbi:hypothetical protein UXI28_24710, partial [Escherichia coli]|nr:hypothetical protein [Escherichia coli]
HLNHAVSRTIAGLKGENRRKARCSKRRRKALLSDIGLLRVRKFNNPLTKTRGFVAFFVN